MKDVFGKYRVKALGSGGNDGGKNSINGEHKKN
jgi:hypothetical protein